MNTDNLEASDEWERSFDAVIARGNHDDIAVLESRMDTVAVLARAGGLPAGFEDRARRVEAKCAAFLYPNDTDQQRRVTGTNR